MAGVAAAPRRAISRSIATRCNRPAVIQGCGELAGAPHPVPGHGPEAALPTHKPPCAALKGRSALPEPIVASQCSRQPRTARGITLGPPLRPVNPCTPPPEMPQTHHRATLQAQRYPQCPRGILGDIRALNQGTGATQQLLRVRMALRGQGFRASPTRQNYGFQPELRTLWPTLRALRRVPRVAHAPRTSREGFAQDIEPA